MSTPLRTSGSPPLAVMRLRDASSPDSLCVSTSLPVTTSPHAAALTNRDGLLPRCACQSPPRSLSRISASRVAASGMRSKASARHISATPSCDDSENSCSKPCTSPCRPRLAGWARNCSTSFWAWAATCAACGAARVAAGSSWATASGSAMRVAAVTARRSASAGRLESGSGVKIGISVQMMESRAATRVRGLHHVNTCIACGPAAAVYIGKIIAGLPKNESLYLLNSKEEITNE